jgi:hypothetical protein
MSAVAVTVMTVTFCLQAVGYCALIATQHLQRKRLDRLTAAVNTLRATVMDCRVYRTKP